MSVLYLDLDAGVFVQSFHQAAVEGDGGSPEAAGQFFPADVLVQAEAGLDEHLGGGAVARIAVAGDGGLEGVAVPGGADEAQVKAALLLFFGAGAFAGFGQEEFQRQPADGGDGQGDGHPLHVAGGFLCALFPFFAIAGEHGLVILKLLVRQGVGQGVAA